MAMRLTRYERREHTRFAMPSMYTPVWVREPHEERFTRGGHAYDLSRGGMRFELDEPVEPGRPVAVKIALPGAGLAGSGGPRAVHAMANLVWVEADDVEAGGPVRMACAFRNFCGPRDEASLLRALDGGRFALAA